MTNNLSVVINADAPQVWTMLREPSKVAQWHGWQAEDLDSEIKEIYFSGDVQESPDHHHCHRPCCCLHTQVSPAFDLY